MSVPERQIHGQVLRNPRIRRTGLVRKRQPSLGPRLVSETPPRQPPLDDALDASAYQGIVDRIKEVGLRVAPSIQGHTRAWAEWLVEVAAGLRWDRATNGPKLFTAAKVARLALECGLIRPRGHRPTDEVPDDEIKGRLTRQIALTRYSYPELMSERELGIFLHPGTGWPVFTTVASGVSEAYQRPLDAMLWANCGTVTDVYTAYAAIYHPERTVTDMPGSITEAVRELVEEAAKRTVRVKTTDAETGAETVTTVTLASSLEATVAAIVALAAKWKGQFTESMQDAVLFTMGDPRVRDEPDVTAPGDD